MAFQSTPELSKLFLAAGNDNNEAIRELLHRVVDLGIGFKTSENVSAPRGHEREHVSFTAMPDLGISPDELVQAYEEIASKSSNWGSPNFLGFPDAGNNMAGLAAAVLTPLLNQNMANQDICSPEATFIEMETIHWLREALGYPVPNSYSAASSIGGILTLGGCLSNCIALVAAREKLFPGCSLHGLPVLPSKIRVLVPAVIEHYSIRSSMGWLSLGEQNVIRVPVDDQFRMNQTALKRIIDEQRDQGNHILACVAYAGDSRSMRIDNLDSLADILQKEDIWFHVDACHGSQLAFSNKHKHKLHGIEKADSITIDPHKVLTLPYTCSFVLFKDPAAHAATATSSDLILNTQWSLGRVTPFIGSKAFDALKLWSVLKFLGKARLGQLIDERLDLTHTIQCEIEENCHDIVLMNDSDINSCMMAFIPQEVQEYCFQNKTQLSDADLEKLNKLNHEIKEGIRKDGTFYVHGFPLKSCPHEQLVGADKPLYVLWTMNGNPASTIDNVRGLLSKIGQLGRDLFVQTEYQCMGTNTVQNRLQSVEEKLNAGLHRVFGSDQYVAVIYGSSALDNNALLSDIDLMVLAPATSTNRCSELESMFRTAMDAEGILIDAEVPFEKKLLVALPLAKRAAKSGPPRDEAGHVLSIRKTPAYLASDEMLRRLVFNVLTTPNRVLSASAGGADAFHKLEEMAGHTLVELIRAVNPGRAETSDDFVALACSDGSRSGEEYLGYKMRANVLKKLAEIYQDVEEEEDVIVDEEEEE
ncbi:pyridoxal phosphate-dependent transferase [Mycena amicta]|nr:pyridoxal phosphate-dependent transferase [Mycena amicta]